MLSEKEVQRIAQLARLRLTPQELEKYQKSLSLILDYIAQLEEVNVEGVAPTSHSINTENIMRDDVPRSERLECVKKLGEAAPQKEGDYIRVKTIL